MVQSELINKPYLTLSVIPHEQIIVQEIFEGRDGNVTKIIDNPPKIRYAGFDLDTGQNSKIIEGKKRQSIEKGYKALELWKNGISVFAANAGPEFLSWGNYNKQQMLRINDFALVEVCYLFSVLINQLLPFYVPSPAKLSASIKLNNLTEKNKPCFILGTQGYHMLDAVESPGSGEEFYFDYNVEDFSPEIFSFCLASCVYEWFGVEHNKIPLTIKKDGIYQVDPEMIKNLQ